MSQILKGFVDGLNHPRGHLLDLEALGVTTDGHTPGVGWEELPSPTFPSGPDGERLFATELSSGVGIGWDEKARVLYFGVEFSVENRFAEKGQAARTKTMLSTTRRYKDVETQVQVSVSEAATGVSLTFRPNCPMSKLVSALSEISGDKYGKRAETVVVGYPYLVCPLNEWKFEDTVLGPDRHGNCWVIIRRKVSCSVSQEIPAKIAVSIPPDWRVVWNSGHHRPGIVQELRLWPGGRMEEKNGR